MKFGKHNVKAEQRLNAIVGKMLTSRVLFVLLALASMIVVAAADQKFTG